MIGCFPRLDFGVEIQSTVHRLSGESHKADYRIALELYLYLLMNGCPNSTPEHLAEDLGAVIG